MLVLNGLQFYVLTIYCGHSQDDILGAVRKFFNLDMSRIIVMLVCFPGLRTAFRLLFRFAPSHKLLAFVLNHVRVVMEHRRKEKEVLIFFYKLNQIVKD